ncbi:MAG: hypothetical protein ABEJ72_08155, partial [Candidatus Aenigmatarchaeota archaeon]
SANPIFSNSQAQKTIETALDLEEDCEDFDGETRFEELIVENIREKTRLSRKSLEASLEGRTDYVRYLISRYGVTENDLKEVIEEVEKLDIQGLSKKISGNGYTYENTWRQSDSDLQEIEEIIKKLAKLTYTNAPQRLREEFGDEDSYMQTVSISKSSGTSSHRTGNIFISATSVPVAKVFSDETPETERYVNVAEAAELVGEEGLLGHQGSYLLTNSFDLPYSLRTSSITGTFSSEVIGQLGRGRMIEILGSNIDTFEEYIPSNVLQYILDTHDLSERVEHYYNKFTTALTDYLFFGKERDFDQVSERLVEMTGRNYFASDKYEQRYKNYEAGKFWDNYSSRLRR